MSQLPFNHSKTILLSFTAIITVALVHYQVASKALFSSNVLPGMHRKYYSQSGDINIGALVLTDGGTVQACAQDTILSAKTLEQTEAVAFAVDLINRDTGILPNIKLGFVVQGLCWYLGQAIASSLVFLSEKHKAPLSNDNNNKTLNVTGSPYSCDSDWSSHDVIGVIPMGSSAFALSISSLYAVAKMPLLGATEISDELSDKKFHPYFFRLASPQRHKAEAILQFLNEHGWSYISILFSDYTYDLTTFTDGVAERGICIATMHRITPNTDYDSVVSDLLLHSMARVVVLFIPHSRFSLVLRSVVSQNATGHFVWIGGNLNSYTGIYNSDNLATDPGIGTFYFDTYSRDNPAFFEYLRKLNPTATTNPWLRPVWEYIQNCSLDAGTCNLESNILESSRYRTYKGTSLRIDAVLTLAHAAHDLIANKCPNAQSTDQLRSCVSGESMRLYLKNTSLDGFVGPISFDENQDMKGKYAIKQFVYDSPTYAYLSKTTQVAQKQILGKEKGFYDVSTGTFTFYTNDKLSWSHLNVLERVLPLPNHALEAHHDNNHHHQLQHQDILEVPESVCSRPCLDGEYKIEKNVPCCWDCRQCRDNERLVNNNTSCQACPPFTWPDPETGLTTCLDLPLSYSSFTDTIPLALTTAAILALLMTLVVTSGYILYRNRRVIKASSRELSLLQLGAIFLGYSTVIMFQAKPSRNTCRAVFVMFCMSFALLYCPLLAKTMRIFRIFKSGAKNRNPMFISQQSQLAFSGSLIAVQITLSVVTLVFFNPNVRQIQPIWTEKLAELSCDLTLPGLASFLCYNILLVCLCSVFAFLTRKLPDNFNESKFISMCVCTTLLIWLAFIPTYFTAAREFVRVFLLSVALLLNHTVALTFLFLPKIYAAVFLEPNAGDVSKNKV